MKSLFSLSVVAISLALFLIPAVSLAETSGTIPPPGSAVVTPPPLQLVSLETNDDTHLDISFSTQVSLDTLKLKIVKQSDASNIRILSLSGKTENPNQVRITLDALLLPGTAYTLTVVSAVGQDGSVIRDGALALKDFVTPSPLPSHEMVVNAAPNPNAILVKNPPEVTQGVLVDTVPKSTPAPVVKKEPKIEIKELPLTGMNPLFLLVIIFPAVLFFIRKKKA